MAKIIESISIQEARKLALLSQQLPGSKQAGPAIEATLSVINHLGYVQIDTISVVERAHHHTLWTRNPRYEPAHLDQLVREKQVFEYWSHAAAYLPMRHYRFSLPRKAAIANGELNHWYEPDKALMKYVLQRITSEGPLMAKDFEHKGEKSGDWGSKPSKRALECLFMQGDLMIPYRKNFHKVYELTEHVIPPNINTEVPKNDEYFRFLITQYLKANGIGQAAEISYLLKNTKSHIIKCLNYMHTDGELIQVKVNDEIYFALPLALKLLNKPFSRSKLKILSPFDNFLIQRKRMQRLFDFNYQIECYVPEPKRQYGYFSLPILWDGKLVARMDCKADRKSFVLHIRHLALEPSLKKIDAFFNALHKELKSFMDFNKCAEMKVDRVSPSTYASCLQQIAR